MSNMIEQMFTGYGPLGVAFKTRMGLDGYRSKNKPLLIFGCFDTQIKVAMNHKDKVVIVWRGGDINNLMKQRMGRLKALGEKKNVKHIAVSNFTEYDLKKLGFDYKRFTIPANGNEDIEPCPRGDSLYIYKPKLYKPEMIRQVCDAFKDINIIKAGYTTYDRAGILDVYSQCFAGIRPIGHDGLSNSVIEMGLMGRRYAWNGGTSSSVPYEDVNDIINFVSSEYDNRHSDDYLDIANGVKKEISSTEYLNLDIWDWS